MADTTLKKEDLISIKNEIIMSEELNKDKLLPSMIESVARYTGKYVPEIAHDWDLVLNEVYSIIQYEIPSIFFRNPRAFLKPKTKNFIAKRFNPETQQKEEVFLDSAKAAKTQESILNYAIQEINYKDEVRKVLMDSLLFKHGVLWHGYKGSFGMTEEQSIIIKDEMVFVKRISPMMFHFDPCVTLGNLDEAKWVARSFMVPKNDLLEDETLDVDKKAIKGELGYGQTVTVDNEQSTKRGSDTYYIQSQNKTLLDYADNDFRNSDNSKFVKVYEVFKRPSKKEARNAEKGKVILFTMEQEKPLRVSKWPYKAEGWPAQILMFNEIPDSTFGLSDIEVYGTIADHKNAIINLQLRNAQENSKVWVGISKEGTNEEDVQKVQVGDQTLVFFEGGNPRDKMFVASPGGTASSELYLIDQRIQANLDEKSGVTDLKKGFLRSGEESATSVQIRAAGSSARPMYRQDLMTDFLKKSFHFLNQLLKQFMPIKDAVRIIGSLDIEWSENPDKDEIQADTDVDLDVISMLPENPQKETQELMTILNLMTEALSNPAIFQQLQKEGKTINLSPIIENLLIRLRIRDPEVFRDIRPEESEGMVSVKEIRDARANVEAALSGQQQIPSPPQPGQDHVARLEVYSSIYTLIKDLGESIAKQIIEQLIVTQQALAEEEMKQKAPKIGTKLNSPKLEPVGM